MLSDKVGLALAPPDFFGALSCRCLVVKTSRRRVGGGTLVPGQRFGGHEIIDHLATGGMAELYVARASGPGGFDKLVVLKRVLPQLADQDDFVKMFLDEARLAATLQHQNIAQIHEFGSDDGTYFYTMEYLRGCDLAKVIRALARGEAAIDLAATVTIGIGAATGLHHAHEQRDLSGRHLGIVHRDVSPSNIIVSYDGGVKLVDFGIAKASGQRTITADGSIKGKVPYMAPEQCNAERADRRSDVYSLGVVLFELSTGQRLFYGESELHTIRRILLADVPNPATLVPGYPPTLARVIARAMALDPRRRYQTALELAMALEELAVVEDYTTSALTLASWARKNFGEPEVLVLPDAAPGPSEPESTDVPREAITETAKSASPPNSQLITIPARSNPAESVDERSSLRRGLAIRIAVPFVVAIALVGVGALAYRAFVSDRITDDRTISLPASPPPPTPSTVASDKATSSPPPEPSAATPPSPPALDPPPKPKPRKAPKPRPAPVEPSPTKPAPTKPSRPMFRDF